MTTHGDIRTRFEIELKKREMISEKAIDSLKEETNNPGSLHANFDLIKQIEKNGMIDLYKRFTSMFPNGQLAAAFVNYIKTLNQKESIELANSLYSLKGPSDLTTKYYSNRSDLWGRMFDLAVRGAGKGEVLIAWLIKDASIQGGVESFDVLIGKDKYEVKDWSKQGNAAILTGVKSKVSNFEFWKEVVDTLRRLDKLTGYSTKPKFDMNLYFDTETVDLINKILSRQNTILSGEFSLGDIENFKRFYTKANSVDNQIKGYTNVILRGPNIEPLEISINPIQLGQFKDQITITKTAEDQSATYILTELKRLKYVRNPKDLENDMQTAVNQIVKGITYIVFRKDTINITNDFVPSAVSISSLKFVERSIKNPVE